MFCYPILFNWQLHLDWLLLSSRIVEVKAIEQGVEAETNLLDRR